MSKLSHCPFCGGEVDSSIAYTASMINCENSECIMIGCLIDNEPFVDEIEKKWNESHANKEIQKRDELLAQAKIIIDSHQAVTLNPFKWDSCAQWLKQYEEMKR